MIFVDSAFWIALRSRSDAHHREAVDLFRARADDRMVTTNHVRGETWTYLRAKVGHRGSVGFHDLLAQSPRIEVVFISEDVEKEALRWLRRHGERPYSFVDATSFALMRSMNVSDALTFDDDFAAAGFNVLRVG